MAAPMTAPLFVDHHLAHPLVAGSAGIMNSDRVAGLKGVVIHGGAMLIHEWNVAAMAKAVVLIAHTEVNVTAGPAAPRSPEVISKNRHGQAGRNNDA